MQRFNVTKQQVEFHEIIRETSDYKIISKSADLAIASTIKGLMEWCDELSRRNIESLTPEQIKIELNKFIESEANIKAYYEKIKE